MTPPKRVPQDTTEVSSPKLRLNSESYRAHETLGHCDGLTVSTEVSLSPKSTLHSVPRLGTTGVTVKGEKLVPCCYRNFEDSRVHYHLPRSMNAPLGSFLKAPTRFKPFNL